MNRLPVSLTSFVGRARECEVVTSLLRADARLVTLTGPGGIGKTRLALECARALSGEFPAGTAFVDLSAVFDPGLVSIAIGKAVELPDVGGGALIEQLSLFLGEQQTLLVIDNFEQVIDAASLLPALLSACPNLKMIVTSREVLRVSGEHAFPVPPLHAGPSDEPGKRRSGSDAVALFMARARSAQVDFVPDHQDIDAIARIVERLDGLPLAIELAAARVRTLPPAALAERLDRRLPLLTGGSRDLPKRQQTLWSTIAWSYVLLSPTEQRLFRALGVFAGSFTPDAAEAISRQAAGGSRREDTTASFRLPSAYSVLDGITSLVEKSLLLPEREINGIPRYRMLETIREFAAQSLTAAGEASTARENHAIYILDKARAIEGRLLQSDPASTDWTSLFDVDFDNIRGAINWYFDVNRTELGLEIAARLWKYFRYGWHIRDGIQWLTQGLERAPVASTPVRALAFLGLGVLQEAAGELDSARADAESAYTLYQELHDDYGMAISAALVGELALFQGDLDGAETMCRVAQHYFLGEEFVSWAPFIWKTLGHVARLRGDREAANASFQESLRMAQKLDNRWGEAEALVGMAETHMQTGELSTLAGWLRDALHHYLPSIDPLCVGVALGDVAELAARALMPVEALTIVAAEDRYHRETGYQLTGILASPHIMALQFAQMRLSKDEFNVSWSAGAALSISETVEVAHRIVGDIWSRQQQTISSISWADSPGALSARELDVLRLLPAGKTDQEIADTLFIARRTVTTHVGAILAKLGVANRTEAAAKAVNDGII